MWVIIRLKLKTANWWICSSQPLSSAGSTSLQHGAVLFVWGGLQKPSVEPYGSRERTLCPVLGQWFRLCSSDWCDLCSDLGKILPVLCLLDVFGLVQDSQLPSLRKEMSNVSINSRPFSSVARPMPASRLIGSTGERTMWNRKCRLRFRLWSRGPSASCFSLLSCVSFCCSV